MSWRPEVLDDEGIPENWDKRMLDQYMILSGWKPANPKGALALVKYVADAMLEVLKTKGIESILLTNYIPHIWESGGEGREADNALIHKMCNRTIAPIDLHKTKGWLVFIPEDEE